MEWGNIRLTERPVKFCGLCGRVLYTEEIAREEAESRHSSFGLLCGACRSRWDLANEETIIEHFAYRLRQRGHTVKVLVDGREI